jgi:hypothetical protein
MSVWYCGLLDHRVFWIILFVPTMSTVSATMAIKKPTLKSKHFHASFNHRCMCSWKKPAIELTDTELPWCEYLWQKVAQHADSNDVWLCLDFHAGFWPTTPTRWLPSECLSSNMSLDLKTKEIIQTSSSRDVTSLECCWNVERLGKSRLALPSSVPYRQNS